MRLLLVEDEPDLRSTLRRALLEEGFVVDEAADGIDGLHLASEVDYDAIVLDLMLPGQSGLSILQAVRRAKRLTPVVVLTARDAVGDRVDVLNAGADDYVIKPFALGELIARLRAVIRRSHGQVAPAVVVSGLEIDLVRRRVHREGQEIALTAREFAILAELVLHRGQILSRTDLADHLYDESAEVVSNTIDVHVASLRRKLGSDLIETRRGMGYLIDA